MTDKALVVLSGGQDSTTCLAMASESGLFAEIHAITFNYGQLHSRELEAAQKIAGMYNVDSYEVIHVGPILAGTSPLTNKDEELEQYDNSDSLPGGLEKTFVPARNMLFLTLAANRAYVLGCQTIFTGVCEEDYGGYPDCRQNYIDAHMLAMNLGIFTGEGGPETNGVQIATPLMRMTKADTVKAMYEMGFRHVDALAYTHTSYDGQYPPTGKDHATLLREKGFRDAGLPDPLVLRAVYEGLMELPEGEEYKCAHYPNWNLTDRFSAFGDYLESVTHQLGYGETSNDK